MYDIQDGKCILYSEVLRPCGSIKLSKNVFIYTQKTSTSIQPGTRCCGICSARISGLGPEVWHPWIEPRSRSISEFDIKSRSRPRSRLDKANDEESFQKLRSKHELDENE